MANINSPFSYIEKEGGRGFKRSIETGSTPGQTFSACPKKNPLFDIVADKEI